MPLFDYWHRMDLRDELQEIYLHRFMFTLAINTVTVFLPFYVYQQTGQIRQVFLFFILYYAMFIVVVWPAAKITGKIGYKHTSLLSSPFILMFYLLLRSSSSITMTFIAAMLGGVGFLTYWMGMNSEMARNSHEGHRSEESGWFFSVPKIAAIISPLIGGLILAVADFKALFAFALVSVAVSYTPFLLSREHFSGMSADIHTVFNRNQLTDFIAFMFRGFSGLYGKVIWPLYIAVVIGGSLNIGGAGSIMSIGGVLASIALGKIVTPQNRARVMIWGSIVTAGTFIMSGLIVQPAEAFLISFANGVAYLALAIPMYSSVMEKAIKEDIIEYFAFREVGLITGRLLCLSSLYVVFTMYPVRTGFVIAFSLLGIGVIIAAVFAGRITE